MVNSYGQKTATERHERSLKAADELADKARIIALERDWPCRKTTAYLNSQRKDMLLLTRASFTL